VRYRISEPSVVVVNRLNALVRLCWLKSVEYKFDTSVESDPEHVALVEQMPDWKSAPEEARVWFDEVTRDAIMLANVTISK
jgi:hypothetical protein